MNLGDVAKWPGTRLLTGYTRVLIAGWCATIMQQKTKQPVQFEITAGATSALRSMMRSNWRNKPRSNGYDFCGIELMAEVTKKQFQVLTKILRAKEPPREAVEMVLVRGKSNQEVLAKTDISPQSLSNALGRYRRMHALILSAYQSS